tara:strand:- start:709 stop:957 length:249 start_codon:yes stop_codon:yes gene_type:complete
MKTLANQDESVVVRVSNDEAEILVHEGFHYVPKELWKEKVRDAGDTPDYPYNVEYGDGSKVLKKRHNKMSKSTKRHLRKKNK